MTPHNTTEEVTEEELAILEKSLDGITPPFIQVDANSNVRSLLPRLLRAYREMKGELERERVRLAACGPVALGHPTDGIKPEYNSASLQDVLRMRKYFEAKLAQKDLALQDAIEHAGDFAADCRRLEEENKRKDEVIEGMRRCLKEIADSRVVETDMGGMISDINKENAKKDGSYLFVLTEADRERVIKQYGLDREKVVIADEVKAAGLDLGEFQED